LSLIVGHARAGNLADPPQTFRNTYGEVGLLDMPTAHMAPDGNFGVTMGDVGNYQRYSFWSQRWPWLEASFRYSRVPYWAGLGPVYYDRSFGAKIRFFNETDDFADVSLGLRDLLGTGVYGAEYLVVSKHVGPLDFTAGLGWGRLSGDSVASNPLGAVSPSFKSRTRSNTTGLVNFGQFFHGSKLGAFGGIAWQTPIPNLDVLAEFSSDKYTGEEAYKGGLRVRSPVNLGLSYHPYDDLAVSAGWLYGTTYGFTISLIGDPTVTYPSAIRVGPQVPAPAVRSDLEQQSALKVMRGKNGAITAARANGIWVQVPTPADRARQDLLQAFYSETRGVRNVEVNGKQLVIDARLSDNRSVQCADYARLAVLNGSEFTTVALTDLQDPRGIVTFCKADDRVRGIAAAQQSLGIGSLTPERQAALQRKVYADLAAQSLLIDALSIGTSEAWVYYENLRYNKESEAAGRVVRVLMADLPPSVEIFHIIPTQTGVPMQEITVVRSGIERVILGGAPTSGLGRAISVSAAPSENPLLDQSASSIYPRFHWSLDPKLSEHLFDPNKPIQFMIYADGIAVVEVARGLMLSTELTANLWNNYDFSRPPDSSLPHVRTDLLRYLKEGKYGISSLQGIYRTAITPEVFGEFKAGYLEDMYAGAGAQVLWRPQGSRLSFGADLYQVWKRDYNRLFGLQSYQILTGHVSVYYASPWYGMNYAIHAGRYLAGDYGATFEVTRRFESGVEIGAWATFTNVPFKEFGEGSFDKGLIIIIPFEWGLPIYSQSAFDLHLGSLTRDGGQRLAGDDSLYDETRRTSYGDITENLDALVEP
jgi:hypothetical protein